MKLKLDENGKAVLENGKPVYIQEDGSEIAFDAGLAKAKISQLNGEAKGYREAKEAAEAKLSAFNGIDDPKKALEAIEKLQGLDAKKLIDAGEVEQVKADLAKNYEARLTEAQGAAEALQQQLFDEKIGGAFARSSFIKDKLAIPADVAQAFFGRHFSIKDGQVIAKNSDGVEIYSRAAESAGGLASFEESMAILVDVYPNKDSILKSSGMSGSGEQSQTGGSQEANPWTKEHFNMTKQAEIFKTDRARAIQMAKQHGVDLT